MGFDRPCRGGLLQILQENTIYLMPDNQILVTGHWGDRGLVCFFSGYLGGGDTVLLPAPAYPGYEPIVNMVGADIVEN